MEITPYESDYGIFKFKMAGFCNKHTNRLFKNFLFKKNLICLEWKPNVSVKGSRARGSSPVQTQGFLLFGASSSEVRVRPPKNTRFPIGLV